MVKLRRAVAVMALSVASASCIAVFGMDPLTERRPDADVETGPDPDKDAAPSPPCLPEDPPVELGSPPAPGNADAADDDAGALPYFIVRDLDFGMNLGTAGLGFDLDRFSTKAETFATNSCLVAEAGTLIIALPNVIQDQDGVDNAVGRLLREVEQQKFGQFGPSSLARRLAQGRYGFAIRVEGWNGQPDDDDLRVSVYPLIGYGGHPEGGATDGGFVWGSRDGVGKFIPERERGGPPDLDAGDLWMPNSRYVNDVLDGGTPPSRLRSSAAWMKGGRLVARFDHLDLPVRFDDKDPHIVEFALSGAWLSARLDTGGGLVDGRLGGRVNLGTLVRGLSELRVEGEPDAGIQYGCTEEGAYRILRETACVSRDIRESHCDEGPALPCDALSIGARFETYAVPALGPARARTQAEYDLAGLAIPGNRCDSGTPVDCRF